MELPYPALLACLPVFVVQGLRVRRTVPRLAEAEGVVGRVGEGEQPVRLVVLGDSVAAGVGVEHHGESLAGALAHRIAAAEGRPVAWTVIARGGLTAAGVRELMAGRGELAEADHVVVSVGVNDTKDLHSDGRWRRELGLLLDDLVAAAPGARVVLMGIPPMEMFPSLPQPLAWILGSRSRRMDRIGREVAAARPAVLRMEAEPVGDLPSPFATDGFHPSPALHALFADRVHGLL